MHDRLYTGMLSEHLRLDLEYTPHMTIGISSIRQEAKALCDNLNAQGLSIAGRIETLTVAALAGDTIENIQSFRLGAV
jgi:hypothetical protein